MMKDKSKSRHLLLVSCVALAQKVTEVAVIRILHQFRHENKGFCWLLACGSERRGRKLWFTKCETSDKVSSSLPSLFLAHFVFVGLFVFLCCSILLLNNVSFAVKNSILHNLVSSGLRTMPRVYYMFSRCDWLELLMKNSVWSSWKPWGWIFFSV